MARACQRIGGHMSMEEMTDSAEVIDTGTGQVWMCVWGVWGCGHTVYVGCPVTPCL